MDQTASDPKNDFDRKDREFNFMHFCQKDRSVTLSEIFVVFYAFENSPKLPPERTMVCRVAPSPGPPLQCGAFRNIF